MLTTWVLIVFLAYFAALIGIAVFRSRQMQEMSDYVLGGRRVGSITSALSSGSSSTSGWTMLVFPALAFMNGAIELWTVFSLVVGFWLTWTIYAKRLRRYTIAAENSLTFPEFFESVSETNGACCARSPPLSRSSSSSSTLVPA